LNTGYVHRFTLYRIVEPILVLAGLDTMPLPETFVRRVQKLVSQYFPKAEFIASSTAITREEIKKTLKGWNEHCAMFWAGCD